MKVVKSCNGVRAQAKLLDIQQRIFKHHLLSNLPSLCKELLRATTCYLWNTWMKISHSFWFFFFFVIRLISLLLQPSSYVIFKSSRWHWFSLRLSETDCFPKNSTQAYHSQILWQYLCKIFDATEGFKKLTALLMLALSIKKHWNHLSIM